MLYCSYCDKMVEFNSTAVSSPTAAVTLDLEGDFDPTRIASKTRVLNVCKECGKHDHLHQTKEDFIAEEEESERQGTIFFDAIVFAIVGIVLLLLFPPFKVPIFGRIFYAVVFGGGSGIFVGVVGGLISPGFSENLLFNRKNRTWIGVVVSCLLIFKCYRLLDVNSADQELLVNRALNAIDKRNFRYTDNLIYLRQNLFVEDYSQEQVERLVSASKKGDPKSQVTLGYYKEGQSSYDEAFELYEKAANSESSRAMFRLGVMNIEGLGLYNEEPDVAAEWFSQSGVNEAESIVSRREAIK
ncbi:hypothetical protein OAL53_02860 [Akkermansiaceae bacterium]|nr:hypothetical protein [bacterium]MDB4723985.1 hypothetical protein [Akkermansiaceae bacterium]MDC0320793.1 hypothetical protein [Akkermansiaceae bacterium]